MTPEKINSTEKKNTKENEKTDPSSTLISSLKELQKCNRDIRTLSDKIPNSIEGDQKRMNLIKTVCEKIRDKNFSPEWEDGDTFNEDGENIEVNVNYNSFDKDLLNSQEIQKLRYQDFGDYDIGTYNIDSLSKFLNMNEQIIKKGVESKDYLDSIQMNMNKIQMLNIKSHVFSKKINDSEKKLNNQFDINYKKMSQQQKLTTLNDLLRTYSTVGDDHNVYRDFVDTKSELLTMLYQQKISKKFDYNVLEKTAKKLLSDRDSMSGEDVIVALKIQNIINNLK